jgi:hypothetical protein
MVPHAQKGEARTEKAEMLTSGGVSQSVLTRRLQGAGLKC